MRIGHLGIAVMLALAGTACSHLYEDIDKEPDGSSMRFDGIRRLLAVNDELHVLQTHGMGDHPYKKFCEEDMENQRLRDVIVERLGYHPVAGSLEVVPITVGKTEMGSYSSRTYVDNPGRPAKMLYFSCLSWGEANQKIKMDLLELDKDFLETNAHEAHRAKLNREAKKFVNRSFSDPVIYAGPFGQHIRAAAWKGIDQVEQAQHANRLRQMSLIGRAAPPANFLTSVPTVVISDSLGSRVIFDVLWTFDPPPFGAGEALVTSSSSLATEDGRKEVRGQIRGLFMLANQLPLLALARVEPPTDDMTLDESIEAQRCLIPKDPGAAMVGSPKTIVAMTDINDPLSYHLSESFKQRCAPPGSGLRIVNVTLTNAKPRFFGLFANPLAAHASGFKDNPRAIEYMVEGN